MGCVGAKRAHHPAEEGDVVGHVKTLPPKVKAKEGDGQRSCRDSVDRVPVKPQGAKPLPKARPKGKAKGKDQEEPEAEADVHAAATAVAATDKGAGDQAGHYEILAEHYDIGRKLGEGTFGVVHECWKRGETNPEICAVKYIDKSAQDLTVILLECQLLQDLDHVNVVKCYHIYNEPYFMCVVMQKWDACDVVSRLIDHTNRDEVLPEEAVSHIVRQMSESIRYIHSRQIVHRDVKMDNYLVDKWRLDDLTLTVALSDFGISIYCPMGTMLTEDCGTTLCKSPEFLMEEYSHKVDVWAIGIMMYGLLEGQLPFNSEREILFDQPEPPCEVSPECTDLLRKLLKKNERRRPSAEEAISHPWVSMKLASLRASLRGSCRGSMCPELAPQGQEEGMVPTETRADLAFVVPEVEDKKGGGLKQAAKEVQGPKPKVVPGPPKSMAPGGIQKAKAKKQQQEDLLLQQALFCEPPASPPQWQEAPSTPLQQVQPHPRAVSASRQAPQEQQLRSSQQSRNSPPGGQQQQQQHHRPSLQGGAQGHGQARLSQHVGQGQGRHLLEQGSPQPQLLLPAAPVGASGKKSAAVRKPGKLKQKGDSVDAGAGTSPLEDVIIAMSETSDAVPTLSDGILLGVQEGKKLGKKEASQVIRPGA